MKKESKIDKAPKKQLDLGRTLTALDMRNREYYNSLSDEDKKLYAPVVLMRYLSSAQDQGGLHEYYLTMTNEFVNENFWVLSKHPELLHLLMTIVGSERKVYHSWIPGSKKDKDLVKNFLKQSYPRMNDDEYKILITNTSVEEFEDRCKSYALQDKEISSLLKNFKEIKSKITIKGEQNE